MNDPEESIPPAALRTMQIIASALALGVITFLGIALYMVLVQNQGKGMAGADQPLLSFLAVGFLAMTAPASFVIPRLLVSKSVQSIARGTWQAPQGGSVPGLPPWNPTPPTDRGKLLSVLQTSLIIGMAPVEGACFFGCIAYLMEGQILALAVVLIGLALLLAKFPTESRVRNWLFEQNDQLVQLRQQP